MNGLVRDRGWVDEIVCVDIALRNRFISKFLMERCKWFMGELCVHGTECAWWGEDNSRWRT